ncbi:uroporphyrinogen-III synthase [Pontibacillus marinus]|uniref:Uroporphyrinogen-III synthase n=1 Tax=Pontibacillus marinus BH030004 = DSM 16465 TaxID=1385511 RepID=A0A0A5GF11_9BACI|nr:uroporphyrinogen-III synthase [Pontibacillus marinus]KGX91811.1 uroporphyrinogen-III synthase [Pontibacillus marinus BH030004 = DSM 16465]
MKGLDNKRIAVAASRKADTISILLEKKGGKPIPYPIQGEMELHEQTSFQNVRDLVEQPFEWVVLTTGIGSKTLTQAAANNALHNAFFEKLKQTNIAIRGSKTMSWLKENELSPTIVTEDGTMETLLHDLERRKSPESYNRLFLQAYNQDDAVWKDALEDLGFTVYLSQPYAYKRPDEQVTRDLRQEIIKQSIDAVLFTSKTQVQNLFEKQGDHQLVHSFNDQVLAVAVGKVTAKELEKQGIVHVLQPETPKMGAMVVELDNYYRQKTRT